MEAREAFLHEEDACPEKSSEGMSLHAESDTVLDRRGAGQEYCSWCLSWLAIPRALALGCISPPPDQHPFLAHMWDCEVSFSEEGLVVPAGVRSGWWPAVCFIGTEGGFLNPAVPGNYYTK